MAVNTEYKCTIPGLPRLRISALSPSQAAQVYAQWHGHGSTVTVTVTVDAALSHGQEEGWPLLPRGTRREAQ